MNALIADTTAPPAEQAPAPQGQGPQTTPVPVPAVSTGPSCSHCGQALAPDQGWCLNCGAAVPGATAGSGWRPAAWIAGITTVLVLGAAAAGVAALGKKRPVAPVMTTTVAAVTPPATPTTPAPITPTTPTTGLVPPPKIPLKAVTPPAATTPEPTAPTAAETAQKEAAARQQKEKEKQKETPTTNTGGAGSEPEAVLLDTNAAQTYDPYEYPAAGFGDPSLAIDGDTSTSWTAQVNPATAPRMAEGLLIDLKSPQKLSLVKLVTSTPGMVVQVYGANGKTIPGSITDKAWVALSHSLTIHKRHAKLGLRNKKTAYRFVTLWISRAPATAVGTAEAPGHVTVNELELFPAA